MCVFVCVDGCVRMYKYINIIYIRCVYICVYVYKCIYMYMYVYGYVLDIKYL